MKSSRRQWLSACMAMAASPEVLTALQHAHAATVSPDTRLETLDPITASEIEALAAQILPSTDGPGAREAGVIYFIDRALSTFAADELEAYRIGIAGVQKKRAELFPTSTTVASLTGEQQIELLQSIETSGFFELLRTHTVLGFLGSPAYGGNRNKVGWKAIGMEDRMAYQPPFGYYDAQESEERK